MVVEPFCTLSNNACDFYTFIINIVSCFNFNQSYAVQWYLTDVLITVFWEIMILNIFLHALWLFA